MCLDNVTKCVVYYLLLVCTEHRKIFLLKFCMRRQASKQTKRMILIKSSSVMTVRYIILGHIQTNRNQREHDVEHISKFWLLHSRIFLSFCKCKHDTIHVCLHVNEEHLRENVYLISYSSHHLVIIIKGGRNIHTVIILFCLLLNAKCFNLEHEYLF